MKSVTYWYHFFTRAEELVPIIYSVKFTKCEIYGSTRLILIRNRPDLEGAFFNVYDFYIFSFVI